MERVLVIIDVEELILVEFLKQTSLLELVLPTQDDSGVARYLARRGPGMHHVCLEVDDLTAMLEQLKSRGTRLIHEVPQQTEDGPRYAFIHPESTGGVLVELYET